MKNLRASLPHSWLLVRPLVWPLARPLARQLAWLLLAGAALAARATAVDAPELARQGPQAVGVMALSLDIGTAPSPEGQTDAERRLQGWLWYPAAGAPAAPREWAREIRAHAWRPLPSPTLRVAVPSVAQVDAPPSPGGRLPVVLLSHGLLNWAAGLNDLAEHLASRGYVVLGIEHDDERASNPLASALLLRPVDQAGALETLQRLDATPGHALHRRLALDRVAVVGYSMGGYGALVSAGARVASDGMAFGYVPGGVMARHARPMQGAQEQLRARIAAVVALAPWGGQSSIGALKAPGLAAVLAPTLVVVGDQDDISGYADGVRSLWEQLPARRWLLVYENARHNIALHGAPAALQASFAGWTSLEEPVWRRDRLLHLNRHFVTAFLDLVLLGKAERLPYLSPAVPRSNDGAWPEPFGTPATGRYAGTPEGPITHWTGFQRRWAVGMRLEHRPAATRSP